jgi:hypothetical protein
MVNRLALPASTRQLNCAVTVVTFRDDEDLDLSGMATWLIDETPTITEADIKSSPFTPPPGFRGKKINLAVRLNDVVMHDTKKWFGGANVRLDAIVVHGPEAAAKLAAAIKEHPMRVIWLLFDSIVVSYREEAALLQP